MSPVVLTVDVTMLPAVLTGTVIREQPVAAKDERSRTSLVFMDEILDRVENLSSKPTAHLAGCGG